MNHQTRGSTWFVLLLVFGVLGAARCITPSPTPASATQAAMPDQPTDIEPASPSAISTAQESAMGLFTGLVQEVLADGSLGELIPNARIIFTSESGDQTYETVSDSAGRYQIELPPGRYHVTASHLDYQTYSTGAGFFVLPDTSEHTANIFMMVGGGLLCPFSGHLASGQAGGYQGQSDQPPSVTLSVSPNVVKVGEEFVIELTGTDDFGITAIWWAGEQTGDPGLDQAHWADCIGTPVCEGEWTVVASVKGQLLLLANARDTLYGTPEGLGQAHQASEGEGIACATIVVTE